MSSRTKYQQGAPNRNKHRKEKNGKIPIQWVVNKNGKGKKYHRLSQKGQHEEGHYESLKRKIWIEVLGSLLRLEHFQHLDLLRALKVIAKEGMNTIIMINERCEKCATKEIVEAINTENNYIRFKGVITGVNWIAELEKSMTIGPIQLNPWTLPLVSHKISRPITLKTS
ncbi:hypothetical protein Cgig2_032403 [Carnegiea gigantea]|uniref:Uncharacterized protein n=1 Tax=Carnegiea gigantea TaxID=171969 RepID=A0A9Q1GHD7_9CARY|nr:hypothetical protein Cgig2_032403 [Carnegiea gigantea]